MWSEKGDVVISNKRNSCDPDLCKTKSASICLQSRCSIEAILSLLNFDIVKNSYESVSSPKSIWGPFIAPKGEKGLQPVWHYCVQRILFHLHLIVMRTAWTTSHIRSPKITVSCRYSQILPILTINFLEVKR